MLPATNRTPEMIGLIVVTTPTKGERIMMSGIRRSNDNATSVVSVRMTPSIAFHFCNQALIVPSVDWVAILLRGLEWIGLPSRVVA